MRNHTWSNTIRHCLITVICVSAALVPTPLQGAVTVKQVSGQAEVGTVEIHGLTAGDFDPAIWRSETLHILPDTRHPIIAPRRAGVFRNIYAPSAVQVPGGWRLFYGAWDGVPSGNDRIYSVFTRDFLDFDDHRLDVDHGTFIHVCNVNAIRLPDGRYHLVCTAYPVGDNTNKPAIFTLPGLTDDAGHEPPRAPIQADKADLATIEGYAPFEKADMNGVNVLLFEDGQYRLYFGDFKNWGKVQRASSSDGKHFTYEGPCLDAPHMVNDVKKFTMGSKPTYLMGLHANGDHLWYALSDDGRHFEPEHDLARSLGKEDRYIVAIGWVVDGQRLLGFVYGAGAVPGLNRNRLFARWLQKRVMFVSDAGQEMTPQHAMGPDRAILDLGEAQELTGRLRVYAEDGVTKLSGDLPIKLVSGAIYQLSVTP